MQRHKKQYYLTGCSVGVLFAFGAMIGAQSPDRSEVDTPLHAALRNESATSSYEALDLLRKGANPNIIAPDGATPLLLAAGSRGVEAYAVVEELLRYGADVDQSDSRGCEPIALAASFGNVAVMDLLIRHGADVDGGGSNCPPLLLAYMSGEKLAIELLEKYGARLPEGIAPLMSELSDSLNRLREMFDEPIPEGVRRDEWAMRQTIKMNLGNPESSERFRFEQLERLRILDERDRPEGTDRREWTSKIRSEAKAAADAKFGPDGRRVEQ